MLRKNWIHKVNDHGKINLKRGWEENEVKIQEERLMNVNKLGKRGSKGLINYDRGDGEKSREEGDIERKM